MPKYTRQEIYRTMQQQLGGPQSTWDVEPSYISRFEPILHRPLGKAKG